MTLISILLAIGTFKRNSKKDTDEDKEKAAQNEARLVAIEKDVQYIRISIDKLVEKVDAHDKMLTKHDSALAVLSKKKKGD